MDALPFSTDNNTFIRHKDIHGRNTFKSDGSPNVVNAAEDYRGCAETVLASYPIGCVGNIKREYSDLGLNILMVKKLSELKMNYDNNH